MPREKEDFRDNLVRLDEHFPVKNLLTPTEVGRYLGINYRTAQKLFPFQHNYISKVMLARKLS